MYSQNKEEQFILEHFGDFIGTFIDIGANDGKTFSNTYALALKGWRGLLVEPSPKAFVKLKETYDGLKGFYQYNVAIGDRNGKAPLYESASLVGTEDVGLVSTFHSNEMDRFKNITTYEPIIVKTQRWLTFLNMKPIKEFDFVSLDVEGDEMNILPQMDLSKTKCICIEYNGHRYLQLLYEQYLNGFNLIYTSGENLIYAKPL